MTSNPLVSIIVLNWNGEKIFPACLVSLAHVEYRPLEILFADNGSTDGSLQLASDFQGIKIVDNKVNLGYAAGNNRAMQFISSDSKYVCFLNNDVIVSPSWLNDAVRHLEGNHRIGAIACRNMDFYNPAIIDGLYHCIERFFSVVRFGRGLPYGEDPLFNEPGFVLGALGASAIYRTDIFTSLSGFDETFSPYYEDTDLCMRINNSGYRCLYVPSALVYHMDQASFGKHSLSSFYYGQRNRLFFLRKNFPSSFLCRYLPKIVKEDLRMVKCCLHKDNDLKTFLKARKDSLLLLHRYRFKKNAFNFDADFIENLIQKKKILL